MYQNMPPAGTGMVTLRFRFPNGKNETWRFDKTASVNVLLFFFWFMKDLYNFAFAKMETPAKFVVSKNYPKVDLHQLHNTLEEAGVGDMEGLVVTKF